MAETGTAPVELAQRSISSFRGAEIRFAAYGVKGDAIFDRHTPLALAANEAQQVLDNPNVPHEELFLACENARAKEWTDRGITDHAQQLSVWKDNFSANMAKGDRMDFMKNVFGADFTPDKIDDLYKTFIVHPDAAKGAFTQKIQSIYPDQKSITDNMSKIKWLAEQLYGQEIGGEVMGAVLDFETAAKTPEGKAQIEKEIQENRANNLNTQEETFIDKVNDYRKASYSHRAADLRKKIDDEKARARVAAATTTPPATTIPPVTTPPAGGSTPPAVTPPVSSPDPEAARRAAEQAAKEKIKIESVRGRKILTLSKMIQEADTSIDGLPVDFDEVTEKDERSKLEELFKAMPEDYPHGSNTLLETILILDDQNLWEKAEHMPSRSHYANLRQEFTHRIMSWFHSDIPFEQRSLFINNLNNMQDFFVRGVFDFMKDANNKNLPPQFRNFITELKKHDILPFALPIENPEQPKSEKLDDYADLKDEYIKFWQEQIEEIRKLSPEDFATRFSRSFHPSIESLHMDIDGKFSTRHGDRINQNRESQINDYLDKLSPEKKAALQKVENLIPNYDRFERSLLFKQSGGAYEAFADREAQRQAMVMDILEEIGVNTATETNLTYEEVLEKIKFESEKGRVYFGENARLNRALDKFKLQAVLPDPQWRDYNPNPRENPTAHPDGILEHTYSPEYNMAYASDRGVERKDKPDEDSVGAEYLSDLGETMLMMADGAGGSLNGKEASKMATAIVRQQYEELRKTTHTDPAQRKEALQEAIRYANDDIKKTLGVDAYTTGVFAILDKDGNYVIANVGDSRAYKVGLQKAEQLTTDDSLVASLVNAGVVAPQDVFTHPERNVILKSIGGKKSNLTEINTVDGQLQIEESLLLCCDGLWEMTKDPDGHVIHETLISTPFVQEKARRLIALANSRGGEDNVSVVIARRDQ